MTEENTLNIENHTEILDLAPALPNPVVRAYCYKVITHTGPKIVTVVAPSTTVAKEGLKHYFPNSIYNFKSVSEIIIQII